MARLVTEQSDTLSPIKEDGTRWPFVMERSGNTIYADSRTELVGYILGEGYDKQPQTDEGNEVAFVIRAESAIATANFIQQIMASSEGNAGNWDAAHPTDEELTAFLTDRAEHPTEFLGIEHWDHVVPLVLVTTHFEPYARRTAPTGNVVWIDPSNETTFLDSLAALGQLALYVDQQPTPENV